MKKYIFAEGRRAGKAKQKLIKEALALKEDDTHNKGWKLIGRGAYKCAYKKGGVVVKFGSNMAGEIKLFKKLKKEHKKFFATIYAYAHLGETEERYVQELVQKKLLPRKKYNTLSKVVDSYNVSDYGRNHNVGLRNKTPVIYDYMPWDL